MPQSIDWLAELISGDDLRAQAAVHALAAADASILPSLLELARSPETDHRWWAVCALGSSPHSRPADLLPFLRDASVEVRQAAALGLCARADESAVSDLAAILADPDWMTAGLAANALVKIGSPSVPALVEAAAHGPQAARILALRALAQIKDHRAIPVMMKVMQEDSALLGHWANAGLERLGLDMVYINP